MASIFFSWSSEDGAGARWLHDRLRDFGLDVWEYTDGLPAGAQIYDGVLEAIQKASIAIICFSDQTWNRPWIQQEADWCFQAHHSGTKTLQNILPVWVGAHPNNEVPKVLKDNQYRVFDLAARDEAALERFVNDLFLQLGRKAPRVVPSALFAMTRQQCRQIKKDLAAGPLAGLCTGVGMKGRHALFAILLERYGDRAEDLAPFHSTVKLLDEINRTIRQVNQWRVGANLRPLFLRWVQDELVVPNRKQMVRDLWVSTDSFLVVDSVSMGHPEIQKRVSDLPELSRTAMLWVPPYTQHLAPLDELLRSAAGSVGRLGDEFARLEREPLRWSAFDTATVLAARVWLHRALSGVSDEPAARPESVAEMRQTRPSQIHVREMLSGMGSAEKP